jgi:hypothetical protein
MHKSQHKNMKQQGNSSPSKVSSISEDLNNYEEEEIPNIEFRKNQ